MPKLSGELVPTNELVKDLEGVIEEFGRVKEDLTGMMPINASHDDCTIISLGYAFAVTRSDAERRLADARHWLSWNGNSGYAAAYVNLIVAAGHLAGLKRLDAHKPQGFIRNGESYEKLETQVTELTENLGFKDESLRLFAAMDSAFYTPHNPRWLYQINERSEGKTAEQFTRAVLVLMESQPGLHY
ncbi:hypothetical protein HYY73_04560 [Candidatus Woesearchaeota archaeon]|nr:hypothetical protein [Candidatus Woesearchaeota archaeon]